MGIQYEYISSLTIYVVYLIRYLLWRTELIMASGGLIEYLKK